MDTKVKLFVQLEKEKQLKRKQPVETVESFIKKLKNDKP